MAGEPPIAVAASRGELFRRQTPEGRKLLDHLQSRRELGLYVSGLPGVGKSTLLLHLVLEDIRQGRSCCVIDPHGDLVAAIMERCSAAGSDRVLLFDPTDTARPVGLDLLDARTEREQDLACQFVIALFEELFLREQQGPILHQAVTNGMRLLMETGGSLAELPVLLSDTQHLACKLVDCTNPWVSHYFRHVWLQIDGSSKAEYLAYFTSKLARFLDDSVLRNILGQKGAPDLERHLEGGGVVLARLARGSVGDDTARLLGMILLHKLERLTLRRDQLPPEERAPFHLYVDEFHELDTGNLLRFLQAARKFNVGITLAHQRAQDIHASGAMAILGTVGHVALFRQGAGYATDKLAEVLWPRYGRRELLRTPDYEALTRVTGPGGNEELGRIAVPQPKEGHGRAARRVRIGSRRRYGRRRKAVEADILGRLGWGEKETDAVDEDPPAADGVSADARGTNK